MISSLNSTSSNAANPMSSLTGSGSASASQTDAAAAQDRFLKLLVAQLNNQDPMNPMDNAQMTSQMAQINTVTGIQQLNESIKSMSTQFSAMQEMQGVTMIGRDVLTQGNTLAINAGVGKGSLDLASKADKVKVEIFTPGGQLLDTLNLGAMSAGRNNFEWNASNYTGAAKPVFKVTATMGSNAVTATTLARDTIASIGSDGAAMTVSLKGGATVKYDDIKSIL